MKKLLYIISMLLLLCFFTHCSKESRLMYKEDPRIYFLKMGTNLSMDSINYSFGVKPSNVTKDTIYIPVRIMGTAAPVDREINLLLDDTSTGKPGYHFSFGPLIMPANDYETKIPVYLYKKPGMKDSVIHINLSIGVSKDFQPGYEDKLFTRSVLDRVHFKISVNDQLLKPANWDLLMAYKYGAFSVTKLKFMIQYSGITDWSATIYPSEEANIMQILQLALYNYNKANGPLIDEFGNAVVFP